MQGFKTIFYLIMFHLPPRLMSLEGNYYKYTNKRKGEWWWRDDKSVKLRLRFTQHIQLTAERNTQAEQFCHWSWTNPTQRHIHVLVMQYSFKI